MLQPPKIGGLHVAFAQRYGQLGRPIPVFCRVLTPFLQAGSLCGLLVRPMSGIQQWMCLNDSRDQHTCRRVCWRVHRGLQAVGECAVTRARYGSPGAGGKLDSLARVLS